MITDCDALRTAEETKKDKERVVTTSSDILRGGVAGCTHCVDSGHRICMP